MLFWVVVYDAGMITLVDTPQALTVRVRDMYVRFLCVVLTIILRPAACHIIW